MNTIKAKLTSFVVEHCLPGESDGNLAADFDLRKNGIVDSIALLMLVRFVESEFRIDVEERDIEGNFDSINALTSYVAKKSPSTESIQGQG